MQRHTTGFFLWRRKNGVAAGLLFLLVVSCADAEPAWHDHTLAAQTGYIHNLATIEARGGYESLRMGSAIESGLAYGTVLSPTAELQWTISRARASEGQPTTTVTGNEAGARHIAMELTSLSTMLKLRLNRDATVFVPWIGAGLHLGLIETEETEFASADGRSIARDRRSERSGSLGGEAAAGIDLYPSQDSALAMCLSVRYRATFADATVEGSIDGAAVLLAVKWDFGVTTR